MYCINCGNPMQENDSFCMQCGTKAYHFKQNKKNFKDIKKLILKLKDFLIKYKKIWFALSGVCILVFAFYFAFNNLYDFTKLRWDETSSSFNVTHTAPTTLDLSVLAYDKEENLIKDITFTADEGEISSDANHVLWTLPKNKGTYTLTASSPSGKKITKTVNVITFEEESENLSLEGMKKDEVSLDNDTDGDGLNDEEEKKYNTDPYSMDTDEDGLSDYIEIYETKTDPLKKDSDNDGISDGDELDLGLNPLKEISFEDGIKDGERVLNYNLFDDKKGVTLDITGKGNIASTTVDVSSSLRFSNMEGVLNKIYNFYTTGTLQKAHVKIKYDRNEVSQKNLTEDNLTLYYFNESTKELEPIETTLDKENEELNADLSHFSKYVIGDKGITLKSQSTEIMFVIDNSISMYSESQMIMAGFNSSVGAIGNDMDFKRLSLTNNMIDMLNGSYKFGVAEFSGNYVRISQFTDQKETLKENVNKMKSHWYTNGNGTNIISALSNGIAEFEENDNQNHYLLLLTDGKNTEGTLSSSKNDIITKAKNRNVKICVIGLGSELDQDVLESVANETGCAYYNASHDNALDEIYAMMGADINYNYVDTDNDNIVDHMILANSGFLVNQDGFSFKNFRSNKSYDGHCFGMALFAMLYYKNELPVSLSAKETSKFYLGDLKTTVYSSNGYDLTNTYFEKKKGKLYDFKITDEGLSLLLNNLPDDFRDRVDNDVWMIKSDYYNKLSRIGVSFSNIDKKKENTDFSKYQQAVLNIDGDELKNTVSKDENQVLKAIWRLFILQTNHKNMSFTSAPDKTYENLMKNLSEGTPSVLSVHHSHAINALRLMQNIDDPNKFKIEVYDNNFPGEIRYIELERSKFSKFQLDYTAWVNEYNYKIKYDVNNDGILEKTSLGIISVEVN